MRAPFAMRRPPPPDSVAPRMRRAVLIALAVLVFGVVSFELARFLTTETSERNAVYTLLKDQAAGDGAAMLRRLDHSCARTPSCRAGVERQARALRRPGEVKILAYDSKTAYALGATTGLTRVAWTIVGHGLPVVQCVTVRRSGTVLAGRSITLVRIGAPIDREASC
jgi:hypothetical protein